MNPGAKKRQFFTFPKMNLDEKRQSYKKSAKEVNILFFVGLFVGILFYNWFKLDSPPSELWFFPVLAIGWHLVGFAGLNLWALYKGQSVAWRLLILLSLPGYVIAAIALYTLPDKYYDTERKNSNLTAASEVPHNLRQASGTPPQSVVSNQGASQAMFCPSCGARMPDAARFCQSCGKDVGIQVCQTCGVEIPQGALFCGNCGKEVA